MKLATITVTPEEAKAKLAEYTEAVRKGRSPLDESLARAYRAARSGLPVIRMTETVRLGGWFENGMPKIAVVRAEDPRQIPARSPMCYVRWVGSHLVYADRDDINANRGALVGAHSVRVPVTRPPAKRGGWWTSAETIVPLIPPQHRPLRHMLRHCHLLWEVESWTRIPPEDPALIRHIRGDLWLVLATWDLTELERAVLASA